MELPVGRLTLPETRMPRDWADDGGREAAGSSQPRIAALHAGLLSSTVRTLDMRLYLAHPLRTRKTG